MVKYLPVVTAAVLSFFMTASFAQVAAGEGSGAAQARTSPAPRLTAAEKAQVRADRRAASKGANKDNPAGEISSYATATDGKKFSKAERVSAGQARRAEMKKEVKNGDVQVVGDERAQQANKK